MAQPHTHELDGKLHDDCAMCDRIRALQPAAARDKAAESALGQHQKRAERSRVGRDALKEEKKRDHQD